MTESTANQFKSDGKLYTFFITFSTVNNINENFYQVTLANENIEQFKYENFLNQLYLRAELICVDSLGKLDNFLNKVGVQCTVIFIKMEDNFDGNVSIIKPSKTEQFKHIFLVEHIQILDRNGSNIKYKISLSSNNIIKCNTNIQFSTYTFQNKQKTLINILRHALSLANLTVDNDSFNNADQEIYIDYITNGNDNVQTISKFILNKLFYLEKTNSLKFIRYNEINDMYTIFDISKQIDSLGISNISLSMNINGKTEGLITTLPINLGSINKVSQINVLKSFYTHSLTDYSYNYNNFIDKTIQTKEILNYINTHPDFKNSIFKFKFPIEQDDNYNFSFYGGVWNNDFSIYDNLIQILSKHNSLVVNQTGNILRRPGDYVNISIDRDIKNLQTENSEDLKDIYQRHKGLEGLWIIYKTTHIIKPNNNLYTQNLILFRNFISEE